MKFKKSFNEEGCLAWKHNPPQLSPSPPQHFFQKSKNKWDSINNKPKIHVMYIISTSSYKSHLKRKKEKGEEKKILNQ